MADLQEGRIGQQIGDYRLQRRLGKGTFGTVYLAEHLHDHAQAALKLLQLQVTSRDDLRDFLNEARTIRLRHPHIVSILDFGLSHDDAPYLVMEYAAGGTLHDRHPGGSKVPWETIDIYVHDLASALQYAHDHHIIHRDVKPENMLLRQDGTVLLSDFGIAKIVEQANVSGLHSSLHKGAGTPAYMAPEQSRSESGAASDQYALAIVVYEWLAGCLPFQGKPLDVILQHRSDPPPLLRARCPEIPEQVEQVVFTALAKVPAERFPTVMHFAEALHTSLQEKHVPERTIPHLTPLSIATASVHQSVVLPPSLDVSSVPPLPGPQEPQDPVKSSLRTAEWSLRSQATARELPKILEPAPIPGVQAWSKKPLDAPSVATARREFVTASATFVQITTDLHPYSGVGTAVPDLGSHLSAALRVASVAKEISQAGVTACDALTLLTSRLHEPLGGGQGLTTADLSALSGSLHWIEADINYATEQLNALQPGDLQFDSLVANAVADFHRYLPSVQALLHETDQLLPVFPSLLGISAPALYLVEILDPTELRPGGGAIKDYGIATFIGGRLGAAHITDVNLLDSRSNAVGSNPSLPPAYRWFTPGSHGWNLRDSNLDADFPTAASYAEQNYTSEGGKVALQGVIAITPTNIAQALAITGPISIPELHETITSHTLIDRLHYYQLGPGSKAGNVLLTPGGASTASRYFTELLAQNFLKRVQQLPSYVLPDLLQLLGNALRTKDLQVYFNAAAAETLLQFSHVDAGIPASAGDNLFLVDTNVADNTANQFITGTLSDQVTIDGSGSATHQATIRYSWLQSGGVFGSPLYSDYARVYVPTGSVLKGQQGWQPRGTDQAFGHEVWAGSFDLSSGQTRTVTLSWTEKGVARKDAAGWHYQYLVQRQAGTSWAMDVGITLSSCAANMRTTGGLVARGQTATFSGSLYEDTNLGIDHSC